MKAKWVSKLVNNYAFMYLLFLAATNYLFGDSSYYTMMGEHIKRRNYYGPMPITGTSSDIEFTRTRFSTLTDWVSIILVAINLLYMLGYIIIARKNKLITARIYLAVGFLVSIVMYMSTIIVS